MLKDVEKSGETVDSAHTKKQLSGRALAVVHEALGSVPSAGITAAAATAKTMHASPKVPAI